MLKNIDLSEWIQVVSVLIAMIASIASWRVATVTAKQYKLNQEIQKTNEIKTKPLLAIERIHRKDWGLFLWIENLGFPFYNVKEINSSNDKIKIKKYFKGVSEIKEEFEDKFFILIEYEKDVTAESIISLKGIDVNGNEFCLESVPFIIENGKLINGDQVNKQYFTDKIFLE